MFIKYIYAPWMVSSLKNIQKTWKHFNQRHVDKTKVIFLILRLAEFMIVNLAVGCRLSRLLKGSWDTEY